MSIGTFKTGKQEIHVSIQYFLNAELEPELIRRQVRELVAGGYDCIFGHARQGLTTPYFSEGWWRAIDAIVEECDSLGIKNVDNLVMKLFRENGFPATVMRPCYITGSGKFPIDNLGDRRPEFIADIIAEKTLDLPNDGKALLQPIHVVDLANSFYLSLVHPDSSIGQIYNICLSHAFTLNDYLNLTASVFNKKPVINYMSVDDILKKYGNNVGERDLKFFAEHMCFSIEKAIRDLEYKPSHTPEEAVIETALWAAANTGCKF